MVIEYALLDIHLAQFFFYPVAEISKPESQSCVNLIKGQPMIDWKVIGA